MATVNRKNGQKSESGWAALASDWRRKSQSGNRCFTGWHQLYLNNRRQADHRRQCHAEIMRCQTELTGVRWQGFVVSGRMLDRVRPDQQLGEHERCNEK